MFYACRDLWSLPSPLEWCCERTLPYFALEQVGHRARRIAMIFPAMRSDILLLFRKSSAATKTGIDGGEGEERGGGGGGWIKRMNLNGIFDSTVQYRNVPYSCTVLKNPSSTRTFWKVNCLSSSSVRLPWAPNLKVNLFEYEGSGW